MFRYPKQAEVNRVLPKNKIYAYAKASSSLQRKFVEQVEKIVWRYKLAPETINLPAAKQVSEIQVFDLHLKQRTLHQDVIRAIDRTIRHPIAFQFILGGERRFAMAHKRHSDATPEKWVVEAYFESDWQTADTLELEPLPAVLHLHSLYENLLGTHLPHPPRTGESLREHVERMEALQRAELEAQRLEAKLAKEKQFNRKVELNRELRGLKSEVEALALP
jgi:hypothetical protein